MPSPDTNLVHQRLEAARTNLLDLTLRNKLINYHTPKARGLELVVGDLYEVFRILVKDGKPLTFVSKPEKKKDEEMDFFSQEANSHSLISSSEKLVIEDIEVDTTSNKLITNETPNVLSSRLLKTCRDAKSSLEEMGVNILFLTLGMLEWYEADSSQDLIKSPLVLIPVIIERKVNKFQISYEGTEIGENLSLAAKLDGEFYIKIPHLPNSEDLNIKDYFTRVTKAIVSQKRWKVDNKTISLGFFNYNKYLMYKDLEGTQWSRQDKPWKHPILGALLDSGFVENESAIPENEDLDKYRPVDKSYEVVDADSSQILALIEAHSGRSMVIEGPPGTGKSQTITNLIAEAIADGKKVLFVSEKRAALEVVWRNLKRVNLHETCLELHSNKTNKKTFYAKLKETVELGKPQIAFLEEQVLKLTKVREKLNTYCQVVHQAIPGREISPFDAMGYLIALGREQEGLKKPVFSSMKGWNYSEFKRRMDLVVRLQTKVKEIGCPANNPFFDSQINLLLPEDKMILVGLIKTAKEKIISASESIQILSNRLSLPCPNDFSEAAKICYAAEKAVDAPMLEGISVSMETLNMIEPTLRTALLSGRRFSEIRENLSNTLKIEAWNNDVKSDRYNLTQYGDKWWRFFIKNYWKTLKKLSALCIVKLPKQNIQRLALVDAIIELQAKKQVIYQDKAVCQQFFSNQWRDEDSDWTLLLTILDWVIDLQKEVRQKKLPKDLLKYLEKNYKRDDLQDQAFCVSEQSIAAQESLNSILLFLKAGQHLKRLTSVLFQNQLNCLDLWLSDLSLSRLEDLIAFNHLLSEAQSQGMQEIAQIAIDWPIAGDRLAEMFQRCWYSGVLREACEQRPELARFDRDSHEAAVKTFQRLDHLMLELNQSKILLKHWQNVPRHSAGGSLGALQREFEKKSRHKTIRNIMAEAGDAIQAIKPVFMMSPISVAMYLPPEGPKFDLVIFDEASQVKPEDAFCAIIRAKQTIVVGDSKQMPPTNFFDKMMQDIEEQEEDNATRDIESILGLMSTKIPIASSRRRDLRWHYRSRHESLILPSNRLFYKERLVIFPNPERNLTDLGLKFNYHPETVYDRGGSRKNRDEAKIVTKAILCHIKENSHLTLGIVAFSLSQQEAIEDELELLRMQEPAINEFDREHLTEPLFVKNLETVQGDERDVIFISVGYGRDKDGFLSMDFGPVNKEGGERRLNVLMTRARSRCEIFSNMQAKDFRLDKTQSRGLRALRTFIHFAETGELDVPTPSGREPMSPFEDAVIEQLRKHNYIVEPQVGSAGFFIDIGICDPENPDCFILGIECDGAKYHSSRCARDRDRLRQSVLESRGWCIHRIWSTDWWRNQDREMKRLLAAIQHVTAVKGKPPSPGKGNPETIKPIPRKQIPKTNSCSENIYRFCNLNISLGEVKLADVECARIADWVLKVVQTESPVHYEEVVRRIREAAGMERAGDTARDAIKNGIRLLKKQGRIFEEKSFLWKLPKNISVHRNRMEFPTYLKKLEFIHPEEIKAAIFTAVKRSFGISVQEAVSCALEILGFERTTDSMSMYTDKLIQELVLTKTISLQGDILKEIK